MKDEMREAMQTSILVRGGASPERGERSQRKYAAPAGYSVRCKARRQDAPKEDWSARFRFPGDCPALCVSFDVK